MGCITKTMYIQAESILVLIKKYLINRNKQKKMDRNQFVKFKFPKVYHNYLRRVAIRLQNFVNINYNFFFKFGEVDTFETELYRYTIDNSLNNALNSGQISSLRQQLQQIETNMTNNIFDTYRNIIQYHKDSVDKIIKIQKYEKSNLSKPPRIHTNFLMFREIETLINEDLAIISDFERNLKQIDFYLPCRIFIGYGIDTELSNQFFNPFLKYQSYSPRQFLQIQEDYSDYKGLDVIMQNEITIQEYLHVDDPEDEVKLQFYYDEQNKNTINPSISFEDTNTFFIDVVTNGQNIKFRVFPQIIMKDLIKAYRARFQVSIESFVYLKNQNNKVINEYLPASMNNITSDDVLQAVITNNLRKIVFIEKIYQKGTLVERKNQNKVYYCTILTDSGNTEVVPEEYLLLLTRNSIGKEYVSSFNRRRSRVIEDKEVNRRIQIGSRVLNLLNFRTVITFSSLEQIENSFDSAIFFKCNQIKEGTTGFDFDINSVDQHDMYFSLNMIGHNSGGILYLKDVLRIFDYYKQGHKVFIISNIETIEPAIALYGYQSIKTNNLVGAKHCQENTDEPIKTLNLAVLSNNNNSMSITNFGRFLNEYKDKQKAYFKYFKLLRQSM